MSSLCSRCEYGLGKGYRCHHPDMGKKNACDSLRLHFCKRFKRQSINAYVCVQVRGEKSES